MRGEVYNRKYTVAFTLAEVLITLGIIGVVAALTIPNVVTKYQKKATAAQLKKAYNILTNALRMSEANYGAGAFPLRNEILSDASLTDTYNMFETYFVPYLQGVRKINSNKFYYSSAGAIAYHVYNNLDHAYCINNGMCFAFFNANHSYCYILVDLDGPDKGPNRVGRDTFYFAIHFNENNTIIDGKGYQIYNWTTVDQIYNNNQCSKTGGIWLNGHGCTEIIIRNNWEIPDDDRYPW